MRLLLIEDDEDLGAAVLDCLRDEGYAADWQRNGSAADEILTYR